MGPLELHERLQRERQRINEKLANGPKGPGDFAEAYGESNELLLWCSLEVAKLDPSFNLQPAGQMSYDDIIDREA